ncbi:MAG: molybdenum cofactor guanylyltransferase [Syntrophales bacterium]|nr:molybdenum cofactor guanylyltransferase [Syntrophales bacterium]
MTGVILTGGKNTRMGTNKAFLQIRGERLIDRTVRICNLLFEETILVTQEAEEYLDLDVYVVTDLEKGKGPLMGIYTGLFFASSEQVFVVACDMPFLNADFMRYMMETANNYDIVVPRSLGGLEPLHAIYSRRLIHRIEKLLKEDQLKITGFFPAGKKRIIEMDEINKFEPAEKIFFNLNRPADLEAIERFST